MGNVRDAGPEDGLPLSIAERRRAARLLDQQMWCWGRDVHHEDGDALCAYGFHRWRRPAGVPGGHAYTIAVGPGRRLTIWGFALVLADERDGLIRIGRFEFAASWRPGEGLPGPAWRLDQLPEFLMPRDPSERERSCRLIVGALDAIASYEDRADRALGAEHRRARVLSWFKRKTMPGRIAPAWRALAATIHDRAPTTSIGPSPSP